MFLFSKVRRVRRADIPAAIYEPIVYVTYSAILKASKN
jgi:hypothetical protein